MLSELFFYTQSRHENGILKTFYHTHAVFVHKAHHIILAVYKKHSMFPSEKYLHKMILKNVQNF